jgi:hypothetical protein
MYAVGWLLIVSGLVLIGLGIWILMLGAVQLLRQMFPGPPAKAGAPSAPAINLSDLAKLIEAIIKIPQWLLALLAGDLQIWLGYWLATGARLF